MSERNVEIVRRVFDAFGAVGFDRIRETLAAAKDLESAAGDLGELGAVSLEILDPDVELDFAGIENWPDEQAYRGYQGWLEMWRSWLTPWGDFAYEVGEIEGIGDDVFVEVAQRGVMPQSEAPIEATIFNVWTLRNGKVVRLRFFSDREGARAALQAEPGSD